MFPNLRAEMARKDISQKALSELIGISRDSFKNKLNGTTEFRLDEMLAIQERLGEYSLEYLFKKED